MIINNAIYQLLLLSGYLSFSLLHLFGGLLLFSQLSPVEAIYQWSFQSRVSLPSAGSTYGATPSFIVGRGFQTLITGYDGTSDPGIFVHTNDDGYVSNYQNVWSLQAKLVPLSPYAPKQSDGFGTWMVADDQTLIVSSPYAGDRKGFAFIFNGTHRHWSFVQRLQAVEVENGDLFGERMFLQGSTLAVAAKGTESNSGVVYIFQRVGTSVFWSRQSKLIPRDKASNQYFGTELALYGTTVVISAKNNDFSGSQTGSAYVFASSSGLWSQQQKLIALEMQEYSAGELEDLDELDLTIGSRFLGPTCTINSNLSIIMGVQNRNSLINQTMLNSVYIFTSTDSTGRWSLQQKLFGINDTHSNIIYGTSVYSDQKNTLLATTTGPNATVSYIFKTFGNGWSLQSKLMSYNPVTDGLYYDKDVNQPRPSLRNFSNPTIWGGTLLFKAGNEVQIRNKYHRNSCLLIWMSDHFKDGWDTAVLTVRAPDLTNDTFHPHCDQVDPFQVRYCPYDPTDEGVYIVKVFAATEARFYWEIIWQVTLESTGEVYRGDFSTKLMFNFNATTSSFSLVYSENLLSIDDVCYTCTTYARQSWTQLQIVGNSAFWPLIVKGAPYFISNYEGRELGSSGKVCSGINVENQCYQTLRDGVYTLRLGSGPFGDVLGYPSNTSSWSGCGESGGHLDQLVFTIDNSECVALQKYHYSSRCARPPPVNQAAYSSTASPTFGGTVAPTQPVYGDTYVKGKMYALHQKRKHLFEENEGLLTEEVVRVDGDTSEQRRNQLNEELRRNILEEAEKDRRRREESKRTEEDHAAVLGGIF